MRVLPPSRCDLLSTGEVLPKGATASTLNRVVTVELDDPIPPEGSPGRAAFESLDARATAGELAAAKALYLQWLAPHVDELQRTARAEEKAAAKRAGLASGDRAAELMGGLVMGWEYLCRFLAAMGLPARDVGRHRARGMAALADVAREHGGRVADEGVAPRILALIGQGLRGGHGHVRLVKRADPPGKGLHLTSPPEPHLWGYQRRGDDLVPQGRPVGYLIHTMPDAVGLEPAAVLAMVRDVARASGRELGADEHAAGVALHAAAALARTELEGARRRETTRVRTSSGGPQIRVWALKLSALGFGDEPEAEPAALDDGTGPAPGDVPAFPDDVDPFAP